MEHPFLMFLDHTQRRSTVGRTPLDEWSARRRDLYLTTHDTHNRQISMPPVGFKPTISAGKRSETYALDRAATGTGTYVNVTVQKFRHSVQYLVISYLTGAFHLQCQTKRTLNGLSSQGLRFPGTRRRVTRSLFPHVSIQRSGPVFRVQMSKQMIQ